MLKRKGRVITILMVLLLLFTGCSMQTSKEAQQENTSEESSPANKDINTDSEKNEKEVKAPSEELQKKDKGEPVRRLQLALQSIGYDVKEDGIYNTDTTLAVTDLQLQFKELKATGLYDKETSKTLQKLLTTDKGDFKAYKILAKNKDVQKANGGATVLQNPYDQLALVNKQHALPADYIPKDLVTPNVRFPFTEDLPKKQMRQVAATALEKMFAAADKEGLDLFAQSGYRSYERQDSIFASNVNEHGEKAANKFSARPGESEHQTGLTMDVTSPDINYGLTIEFGKTDEGKWIKKHAAEYGFIIRYPKGKENITKYQYEPWHLRFVGKEAAKEIMTKGITLEEYVKGK
ncbi:D-alanyl-D-alanine carboxypeptidase family protein [Virgibacillus halodenitrificans]|uniref:D-alanyl-D-alanine carboxypeptidase family protein n=1 Tax=Virgibacillus halodenitrificans TaxID=1482 RepID=UPI00045CF537|nr:D-alanyl-D-alanine carboxypeptidase family protein [Virgibacillus halodenitrificans]CDQ37206.1 D-alanyl-D-alanine carboxypeptidase [Virgibacillus halodenitrificans]CDQ37374.1 D-alanyl-D-alanine carboxypeptidase [Virgibacillus halodenitrificans]